MIRILLLLSLYGCVSTKPAPSNELNGVPEDIAIPVPVKPPVYPVKGWHPDYDALIKSLTSEGMLTLPDARMTKFCDAWPRLDREARKQFYADLFYSIAYPESGYNNLSMYIEDRQGIDSQTKQPVVSEGLLQLSYQDIRGYPKCRFDVAKDLAALKEDIAGRKKGSFLSKHPERSTLDPIKNLSCGVAIIDRLTSRYPGEFADVLGKYWSVMRRTSGSYKRVWAKMRERGSPCK